MLYESNLFRTDVQQQTKTSKYGALILFIGVKYRVLNTTSLTVEMLRNLFLSVGAHY